MHECLSDIKMQECLSSSIDILTSFRSKNLMDFRQQYMDAFDKYQMSHGEVKLYNNLGKLLTTKRQVHVLDIGCGKGMTVQCFLKDAITPISYTSVDKNQKPDLLNDKIETRNHMKIDVFDVTDIELELELVPNTYDVIFLDIEPHGNEIQVYERFKPFMKSTHMCILKHVSWLDLFGSNFAENFIDKHYHQIVDYFAEHTNDTLSETRDTFIIMNEFGTKNIKCQMKAGRSTSELFDYKYVGRY
jgi:SAM-dependent methyltransferase